MNVFVEHHRQNIRFNYSCFDRIFGNAIIQVLQTPGSVVNFLKDKRQAPTLTKAYFRSLSSDYHNWVKSFADEHGIEIAKPPKGRRDEWVDSYYQKLGKHYGVAVILRSREQARIALSQPTKGEPHIDMGYRFVDQYYFYLRDQDLGRLFVRICPYFPFNARWCINGHEWLAEQLRGEGIRFRQCANSFVSCSDPERLQQLADAFSHEHIVAGVHRWLAQLVPFFSDAERRRGGCGYRLFMSQVEYCNNLVFRRRAALDRLMERLLQHNLLIGRPDKLAFIFGKRLHPKTVEDIKSRLTDYQLSNPVQRSHFRHSAVKMYVRDHVLLRPEIVTNSPYDFGVNKGVENLGKLRPLMQAANDRYLEVQQDVMQTFVDRGQMQHLREATVVGRRRIPGLKLDDPRLLAIMQALVCFAPLATGGAFRTKDLHARAAAALGKTTDTYTLTQLRYDLSKLRAKGLVQKITGTQTYQLTPEGYRLCVFFLKTFHKIYAPLTAGILDPAPNDRKLPDARRCRLDMLYTAIDTALQKLSDYIGLPQAA